MNIDDCADIIDEAYREYKCALSNVLEKVEACEPSEKRAKLRGLILHELTGYSELTCDNCPTKECQYRGDFYNTNGDCLAVK